MNAEFDGIRSKLYKEALREFPEARAEELDAMCRYLSPKEGEAVLEVGAGSGLLSGMIANLVTGNGSVIVSDPSESQLQEIIYQQRPNISVVKSPAEDICLPDASLDAICSLGAMHHVFPKTKAFLNFHRMMKTGGRVVVADVFAGSTLARHFDDKVAKYCITGHEVAFLSREYVDSLCYLAGFSGPSFYDLDIKWRFQSRSDIGIFLYKIHAMIKSTPEKCLEGAEDILGIELKDGWYLLNWPLTLFTTTKPGGEQV